MTVFLSHCNPTISTVLISKKFAKKVEPAEQMYNDVVQSVYQQAATSYTSSTSNSITTTTSTLWIAEEYADVFAEPSTLPPHRDFDMTIQLQPGAAPPFQAPRPMSAPMLDELKSQLKKLQDAGFIVPSNAPFGAPI